MRPRARSRHHLIIAGIQPGDTVVVFGAGPVGIMAARCCWLFGAGRVIIIDKEDYRLEFAKNFAKCEAYNFEQDMDDPVMFIKKQTDWLGADACIDAVGAEAAGNALQTITGRKTLLQAGSATALLGTGFCGGLSTYSTFATENVAVCRWSSALSSGPRMITASGPAMAMRA